MTALTCDRCGRRMAPPTSPSDAANRLRKHQQSSNCVTRDWTVMCECGWQGKDRATQGEAQRALKEHRGRMHKEESATKRPARHLHLGGEDLACGADLAAEFHKRTEFLAESVYRRCPPVITTSLSQVTCAKCRETAA